MEVQGVIRALRHRLHGVRNGLAKLCVLLIADDLIVFLDGAFQGTCRHVHGLGQISQSLTPVELKPSEASEDYQGASLRIVGL